MKYTVLLAALFLIVTSAQAQFAGGAGTEQDPYQVANLDQLQEVGNHLDKHFIQTADINAGPTMGWNEGLGFDPIGSGEINFTGSYDGNGFIIEDLLIFRMEQNEVGLFSNLAGGVIRNVALVNANVNGNGHVGGLVGFVAGGEIYDSYTTGNVSGADQRVGGLVGTTNPGKIESSYSTSDVSGFRRVGGFVGHHQSGGTIIASYATGNVTSEEHDAGGFAGQNDGSLIEECYATGFVVGVGRRVGGFVGQNFGGAIIRNSYATGIASGSDAQGMVGGFVGRNRQEGTLITTSYVTGSAYNDNNVDFAAFAGLNDQLAAIADSYWDTDLSDNTSGVGGGETEGVTGLTSAQMTGEAVADNMTGFDFDDIWVVVSNSHPVLHWEVDGDPTSVEDLSLDLPKQLELGQNYPNPFNPSTQIVYALPVASHVSIDVFDVTGRKIATIVDGFRNAGHHSISFNGSSLASGIYLYRIRSDESVQIKKMMLVK